MKKKVWIFCLAILCSWTEAVSKDRPVKLLMGGSGWNKVVIIDKKTQRVEWEYALEPGWECNSVSATSDGNILFSYSRGAMLVTPDHKVVWNMEAPKNCEMQTARVLQDGNILLAWNGHPAVIMEVDRNCRVISRTEYETNIDYPHSQFRQICKTKNDTYLIPLFETSELREINRRGELQKTVKLEGTPFTALPVSRNEYWVACGDGHSLLRINWKTGEVLQRYGEYDFPSVRLFFVAGLYPAKNKGEYYLCNWQGHSAQSERMDNPQVLQFDAKGRVVWKLINNKNFGMISSICEYPGRFLKEKSDQP